MILATLHLHDTVSDSNDGFSFCRSDSCTLRLIHIFNGESKCQLSQYKLLELDKRLQKNE